MTQQQQEELTPEEYKCAGCGKCEACLLYKQDHQENCENLDNSGMKDVKNY